MPFAELSADGGASWQEVSSGSAVTGIGLTATPQAQQPLAVSLAAG